MRRWRYFLIFGAFAVSACDKAPERTGKSDIPQVPEELAELRSNAFSCWQDSQYAPVEQSEHCVVVAEKFGEKYRKECLESKSYECLEYNLWLANIGDLYRSAVVDSLIRFGVPKWVEERADDPVFPSRLYHDGELLRRMFEACLESEKSELAERGLQPITTIIETPLQPGQRCFRLGHPEFVTTPLRDT